MRVARLVFAGCLMCAGRAASAPAQEVIRVASVERGPRFLLESAKKRAPIDIKRTPALTRRITFDFSGSTLDDALAKVAELSQLRLLYSNANVPLDRRVMLRADNLTVAAVLTELLVDADVDVLFLGNGGATLVRRLEAEPAPVVGTVAGRVSDVESGRPVPQARLTVVGTSLSRIADDSGRYTLSGVPAGEREIIARRVGYGQVSKRANVEDGGVTTLDFVLERVATSLDAVVTTVTGDRRRLEVGNVVGVIKAAELLPTAPVTNFTDLIGGRVAGIQVNLSSNLTGSSPRIRIRGLNSLTLANDPLVVVDGARVENSSGRNAGFGQVSGRLNDLNPEEIESVEIVKGPSAATLYGTDAANGVIVVKTKRGAQGKPKWKVYAEAGRLEQPARFADNYQSWGHSNTTGAVQQCVLAAVASGACAIDSLVTFNPLMNRITTPVTTGARRQHGLQVSGGLAGLTYFIAGEYESETGYLRMPGVDQQRVVAERGGAPLPYEQLRPNALRKLSFRTNFGSTIGPTATANVALGLVHGEVRIPGNQIFQSGTWGLGFKDPQNAWRLGQPGEIFAVRNSEYITHFIGSIDTKWQPASWLTTHFITATDFSASFLDALQRRGEGPLGANRTGRRQNTRTDVKLLTGDAGASATAALTPRFSSRTSVGLQYNKRALTATTAQGTNLSPGSETLAGAAVLSGSEQNQESIVVGGYLEETLSASDRFFFTTAVRADGASSFGKNFRAAYYPKLSVSWVALDDRGGLLNTLRLRSAYGTSGVQPSSIAALPLIVSTPVLVNGVVSTGARIGAIGNPELRPERQREVEAGLDLELLARRAHLELTGYDRLSTDALIDRRLAPEVGIASRQENIGSVRNRGVEGVVSAGLLNAPDLKVDAALNASFNRNRLEKLADGLPFIGGDASYRSREGYPIFSRFARPILGFSDANGNGIIESNEVTVGDSLVFLGPSHPSRQVALSTSLELAGGRLRISSQLDYRGGHSAMNFSEMNRCTFRNCRAVNDPAAPLKDQAAAVAQSNAALGNTRAGFIQDASFLRWREVSVSASLPARLTNLLRSREGTLTVSGRNLKLLSKFSGVDPEVNEVAFVEGTTIQPISPPVRYWIIRLHLEL